VKTKRDEVFPYGWGWDTVTIPAGTPVVRATNLPEGGWWVVIDGLDLTEEQESWGRVYGYFINDERKLEKSA
jgi:hypothetical protein